MTKMTKVKNRNFLACGEDLSAEGRIILTILLILSNYFL
jgi:hypothetical protein